MTIAHGSREKLEQQPVVAPADVDQDVQRDSGNTGGNKFGLFVRRNRLPIGAASVALLLGGTIGYFGNFFGDDEKAAPRDGGVAAGPIVPGPQVPNPNQSTPALGSGGFNNNPTPSHAAAGSAVLECTGLSFLPFTQNGHTVYRVTPQVTVESGDRNSPNLYTVLGSDVNRNIVTKGIGAVVADPSINTEYPVVVLVDTTGTSVHDASDLQKPLGGLVPDSQMFPCPPVGYPGS